MIIQRSSYLDQLASRRDNGSIKVVTGLRRCGKTILLKVLYREWLIDHGVDENDIIYLALDSDVNARFRNPVVLSEHLHGLIDSRDSRMYVIIDEIQMCTVVPNPSIPEDIRTKDDTISFYDVALGLQDCCDLYITGSSSRLLSSDVATMFRGRGDMIRVHPLSFSEFHSASGGDVSADWTEYLYHGGMPAVLSRPDVASKDAYLKDLLAEVYIRDIQERYGIRDQDDLSSVLDVVSSNIGSYTNAGRIADTFPKGGISRNTVQQYLGIFADCFLISEVKRFDIRGRRYINGEKKYYCTDLGLRNARLNFRGMGRAKLIENAVYNELLVRGYDVDVGRIDVRRKDASGKSIIVSLEADFVVNRSFNRAYIQVAMGIDDPGKMEQETASLERIRDGFIKILLVDSPTLRYVTEKGIHVMSVTDFILDKGSLKF